MTKVKAKKKNLKLRRQIRKTVGALFMVSAIVIAAIPVQGLSAETLKAETVVDNRGSGAYPDSIDDLDLNAGIKLDGPGTSTVYTAYSIRQLTDGSYSYNWQFEYYLITVNGNTNAIISKYNDNYPENEVVIGNSANTDYYIVTSEKFNAFYNDGTAGGTVGQGYRDYIVEYADWEDVAYNGNTSAEVRWFQKYEKEGYDTFSANCQKYKNYLDALAEWNAAPDPKPAKPSVVEEPAAIQRNPALDFDMEKKLQYYCSEARDFPGGDGYTLVPVTDNVNGPNADGTAKIVYMAKGGTPDGINGFNDENGFLLTSKSVELIGIAKRAFYNIHNVNTLSMPEEIKYVGDEAFYMSFIRSITFDNVENIGNRAFLNCGQLAEVKLEKGTVRIGAEAFRNSGIREIVLPNSIMEIGGGAFSECHDLQKVDLNGITSECAIGPYAFYNDYALNEVSMDKSNVRSIGEGAFAISNTQTGSWSDVVLPEQMTGARGSELGNYLFQGRNNLKSVKFPINYGMNGPVTLPSGMFRNCSNMEYVDFTAAAGSTICGNVGFDTNFDYNNLFLDVLNPDFYVKGPETNVNGQEAYPRQSTWQAFTKASNFVPYVYINRQGVECYEVSDGVYLLQANEKKELTNCRPIDQTSTTPIDLVIPDKVGAYEIEAIANGAMSDSNLRSRIRTITIQDDSLTKLDNGVFEGLPNLEQVTIGNSVNSIGDRAFANCRKLIDVTFHKPKIGYEGFTIGTDAFKTESNELTMHGAIVPGYAPFEFAVGKDSSKIDDRGKRICYKSLSPDLLTVMYDNKTENVTLLDYPKYKEIDERNSDYCRAMEVVYYEKYGGDQGTWVTDVDSTDPDHPVTTTTYIPGGYDSDREAFTKLYLAYMNDPDTSEDPYESMYYGPWIDDTYLELLDRGCFLPKDESLPDKLPIKYFDKNPYSILENYERGSSAVLEYQTVTDTDLALINTCLNIVVPEGVTSIDATGFFTAPENTMNVSTYFGADDEGYKSYQMCTRNAGGEEGVVPGLFSGYYEDYETDDDEENPLEQEIKGNDRILSITMNDVKYLPDYAFDSCERLQFVSLGDACEDIGNAPFRGCDSLTEIKGNDNFVIENMIIYSVNDDEESYTIEECLPSRGINGSSPVVISSTDPIISNVSAIKDGAFEDCDHVVKVFLDDAKKLGIVPKDAFNDCDALNEVGLPSSVYRVDDKAFGGNEHIEVTIPGKEVHIVNGAFEHVPTNTIKTYKGTSAEDYGNYYKLNVELLGNLYTVRFLDWNGTLLKEQEEIVEHQSAVPPEDPKREGYTFTGWLPAEFNDVTSNMVVVAQYSDNSATENRHTVTFYAYDGTTVVASYDVAHEGSVTPPAAPVRKGYDFVAWVPNTYTNVTQDMSITASYQPSKSTPKPGGNGNENGDGTPSPSPTATPAVTKYTVNVSGGSGSGEYAAGSIVAINAYAMSSGQVFDRWTTSTAGVGFADPNAISTTFTMPAANVTITATYKTGNGSTTTATNGNNAGTTGNRVTPVSPTTNTNTGTTVEVTKPGISSSGLAGATVTGATDNFIVKVSEDQAATNAAVAALQARYGDISRIKYFPMDISLYDSTGRNKITDTTGISVNITLPLPDELREYAGNNRIAHISNNTLEDLGARFTTIDGVPCINFTATQFSPYVIYVDTANLTQGTIDTTPKTGDPIHPKWFLAIGMACISLILFFKKDKAAVKSKTA